MSIPKQVRRESYEETNKTVVTVSQTIYESILYNGPASAWQIANALGRQVYTVRPRITELFKAGKIRDCGMRWCEGTKRKETVWEVKNPQLPLI